MGDPEYVKITITVEKQDGATTVFEIPKSLAPQLVEKMSSPESLDNLTTFPFKSYIEELGFIMKPFQDEETGMMYQVTEGAPDGNSFRQQIRWNG